ncbi:MAG TPA: inositol monophosphatase [Trebonia sp.]|nr:inositol monophosphatase [Trebonia sp.]
MTSSPEEPQTGPEWPLASSAGQPGGMPETRPANAELRLAVAAARAGGAVLMRRLNVGSDLEVGYKDARANLVTAADRDAQRAVTAMILATFPRHLVNGEEGTAGSPGADHVWYVDPLDGTTNYAHGIPFFCVSVALRAYGRTVAGAVYDPLHDELYAAGAEGGATLNGRPLRVSPVDRLDRALVVAQAQTVDPGEIRAYARLVERLMTVTGGVRSLGSPALTLCAVAAGRLEAYCEYAMDAWDIAAGQLILEQAGGRLTLFDGRPHESADRADVVASNGHIHTELITALKDLT